MMTNGTKTWVLCIALLTTGSLAGTAYAGEDPSPGDCTGVSRIKRALLTSAYPFGNEGLVAEADEGYGLFLRQSTVGSWDIHTPDESPTDGGSSRVWYYVVGTANSYDECEEFVDETVAHYYNIILNTAEETPDLDLWIALVAALVEGNDPTATEHDKEE